MPQESVTFDVEPGSPPVVCGVAATLKRSAAQPALAKRLQRMSGVLGLQSPVDKQSATVRFDRGRIKLASGVAPDADMVITLDWGDPSAKPKIKGAVRHLPFALNVAKVMEPPSGSWQQEAALFWAFAGGAERMPESLVVVCTDDGATVRLGRDGGSSYEIQGPAAALISLFSGSSIYGEDILAGKLLCVGSFEHASIITGRSIAWVMGEGR